MPRASKTAANKANSDYISNGVVISPAIPTSGEKVKIMYDGLLAKSGASHLYAHVGFGPSWENLYDYQMTRMGTGFEITIPVANNDILNLCFKDCAGNWDNNSGKNYSFDVTH